MWYIAPGHVVFLGEFAPMSRVKNHRICIHGRQTALRLEPELWYLLRRICTELGVTVTQLLEAINIHRNLERSLSSELRICFSGCARNSPIKEAKGCLRFLEGHAIRLVAARQDAPAVAQQDNAVGIGGDCATVQLTRSLQAVVAGDHALGTARRVELDSVPAFAHS